MRKLLLVGALAATLSAAAACSSFSGDSAPAGPLPSADGGDEAAPPVTGEAAPLFALSVADQTFELQRSKMVGIPVTVARLDPDVRDLVVRVEGLPQGVTASPLTIYAGQTVGTLNLAAGTGASEGLTLPSVTGDDGSASPNGTPARLKLLLRGAPGGFDETFGTNGVSELSTIIGVPGGFAETPSGAIVYAAVTPAAPNISLGRLTPEGVADTTFLGKPFVFGTGGSDDAVAVLVQSDGKIVVVGAASAEGKTGVARFQPSGAVDPTFGGTGKVIVGHGTPIAATIDSDQSIYIVTRDAADGYAARVGRVSSAGVLQPSFGQSDWVTIDKTMFAASGGVQGASITTNATSAFVSLVVYQNLVNAALVTLSKTGSPGPAAKLAQSGEVTQNSIPLTLNGQLPVAAFASRDNASSPEHLSLYDFSGNERIGTSSDDVVPLAMAADVSTRVLIASRFGYGGIANAKRFRLERRISYGTLDADFGLGGLAETTLGDSVNVRGVLVQKNGRIVVATDRTTLGKQSPAFIRYWP